MRSADRNELNKLIQELHALTSRKELSPEKRHALVRKRLQMYKPEELQEFMLRAYIDVLKTPSQISGENLGDGRQPKPRAKRKVAKPKRLRK